MSHLPPPIQPPSRSMTPLSHQSSLQTLSGEAPRQEHTTTFSHKLMNMFSSQVYSIFQANVTIHELANVPQLGGQFTVDWKFRGHKPKSKDMVGTPTTRMANKPSLPNLKLSAIQASPTSSVASFQTSSTSTTTNSPVITHPHSAGLPGPRRPKPPTNKSMSLPPSALGKQEAPRQDSTPGDAPKSVEKKASDPTPLRQSITSSPVSMVHSPTVLDGTAAEPASMDEPRERTESHSSGGSGSTGTSSGSSKARPLKSRLEPSPEIMARDPSISSNISLPAVVRAGRPPSAASSTSRLGVPGSGTSTPGPRSGSSPSVAALVAPPSTDMPPPPLPLTRHISSSTTRSATDSMTSVSSNIHPLRRRTTSGPAPSQNRSSAHRKGETPAQSLKAHTCTWDYGIEHTVRIPLSKPSARPTTPGSATPTGRQRQTAHLSMLGSGPMSESGLRLTIYQVPTPSATSGNPATGANQNSIGSVVQAAHAASHHGDGRHANPSEGRHGSQSDSIKTVFGTVDIDLAAFAGRGLLTRKFLLRGSRTNATIRVSVNMQHVGGDDNWAAPPLQEGHHVTSMHDLVGHDTEDRIKGDLALAKTPSNSSSASSFISARTASNPSSADPSRSASHTDLQSAGKHYGGHLQAGDAMHQDSRPHSKPPSRTSSYSQSPHSQPAAMSTSSVPHSGTGAHHYTSSPHRHQHRNHLHHLRDQRLVPRDRMEHFPPEFIIEAIFNPTAAKEETPFTFVPPSQEGMTLEGGQAAIQKVIAAAVGNEDERGSISTQDSKEREEDAAKGATRDKLGWGERMRQRRERKASRKVSKISTPPIAVD